MDILLVPFLLLIKSILGLLGLVIMADVIISLLIAGNILNTNSQIVYSIVDSIKRISDFMCDPIRRNFPVLVGTLDFSPVVVIIVLTFLEHVVARLLIRLG